MLVRNNLTSILSWTIKNKLISVSLFFCVFSPAVFAEQKFPFVGEIVVDKVNVRAGPNTNFEKMSLLQKGAQVVVIGKEFTWYKIKLPNDAPSFVSDQFVQTGNSDVGMITGNRVNIRSGAGGNFSVIGQLEKGTTVRILERIPGWCRIVPVEGTYGWIGEQFLIFKSDKIPGPETKPVKMVFEPKYDPLVQSSGVTTLEGSDVITVAGRLRELLDEHVGENIRHKLETSDGKIYYLEGYQRTIDEFVPYEVQVEGKIKPDPMQNFPYPVISVAKIHLIL